jgi:hypothetical protein
MMQRQQKLHSYTSVGLSNPQKVVFMSSSIFKLCSPENDKLSIQLAVKLIYWHRAESGMSARAKRFNEERLPFIAIGFRVIVLSCNRFDGKTAETGSLRPSHIQFALAGTVMTSFHFVCPSELDVECRALGLVVQDIQRIDSQVMTTLNFYV